MMIDPNATIVCVSAASVPAPIVTTSPTWSPSPADASQGSPSGISISVAPT